MNYLKTIARSSTVALVLFCIGSSHAGGLRFSCDHSNTGDAKMSARYLHSVNRALFDVSFKAPVSQSYTAQQQLEVRVDGYVVAYVALDVRDGGIIGGSLSFDSYANAGLTQDVSGAPFPSSWPGALPPQPVGVSAGSRVMIGSIGCTLQ